jgi:nicotinamidase-related amidase
MPITTLDPVTALVVIDLQKGIAGLPLAHPIAELLARTQQLARAFRTRGLPVVLVNVVGRAPGRTEQPFQFNPPPDWAELVPELEQQPSDILISKHTPGAFHGTGLDMQLRRHGVTQIVLCGVATGSGVEATARAAYDHGYHVTFAVDAMTDRARETHDFCIGRVFPKLGETGTTADVLAKL